MLKSHEKYYSESGKRQVLVVDDEIINREMLGFMLASDYNVLYAEDGEDALQKIRENSHTLSLVLLDLMMPKLDGFQLMEILRTGAYPLYRPYVGAVGGGRQPAQRRVGLYREALRTAGSHPGAHPAHHRAGGR